MSPLAVALWLAMTSHASQPTAFIYDWTGLPKTLSREFALQINRTEAGTLGIRPSADNVRASALALSNLAADHFIRGRFAEAEVLAERSIRLLEEIGPPDRYLLRPLQILTAVRFEQGKLARARESFEKMRTIKVERPEDHALIHGMAAAFLQIEGKREECEREYLRALSAWEQAGLGETADTAALLNGLGALYIDQKRFAEAERTLDRALAIFGQAGPIVPLDRIKLLHVRAALYARQRKWREAQDDLYLAVSLADSEARMEPEALARLLSAYAAMLRKNHRGREARAVEIRAGALPRPPASGTVVDVTELLAGPKPADRRK